MTGGATEPAGADFGRCAETLAVLAERALATGAVSQIASGDIERVITAMMKLYAVKAEVEATPPSRSQPIRLRRPRWLW